MSFKAAIEAIPHLAGSWQPGLQALRPADRVRVTPGNTRSLRGSVDLDAAYAAAEPNASRWDYGIGYLARVYWVEVHPATDGDIPEVLSKLQWLQNWLAGAGRALRKHPTEFVWVSSGRTAFTPSSPQRRRLAQAGLRHTGGPLRLE